MISSVDSNDFRINDPSPFNSKWYSHKFKGPGLRYEICISLSGHIVWTNGPFPYGKYSHLKIFRRSLRGGLEKDEKIIADGTYKDKNVF